MNANVSRWRKVGAEVLAFDPDAVHADPSDPYQTIDDKQAAAQLFVTLPTRQRAAVVMRFYEQASYAEIAAVLGTAEASARSLVHRALTSLKSTLQEGSDA